MSDDDDDDDEYSAFYTFAIFRIPQTAFRILPVPIQLVQSR